MMNTRESDLMKRWECSWVRLPAEGRGGFSRAGLAAGHAPGGARREPLNRYEACVFELDSGSFVQHKWS